ncbi:L-proline dehydrogenase [Kroppenstedtia eburnea]|uniref:proline dehydrogenase n=2 Tax=Kroppenstedtia eburnea TaxID=714067 RepID=A0A1N7PH33_9BACL|nr:proline dehydrogenase family protein [Kroppenstedtia eburnea]QKI83284.1 proline dehydrogenase [Kroppenstedtia eburnea]SIT09888.1 L-proline dehydrogenase [Kroppenstedtia eburnea]
MSFARKVVLTLSAHPWVTRLVSRYGMKWGASRFVAGETMADTVRTVKELNAEGLRVTLDLLGEGVTTKEEAAAATRAAIESLDVIGAEGLNSTISVKLTQLGLDIDPGLCLDHMDQIAAKAEETGNFVRIDMEDSLRTEATLDLFKTLLPRYGTERIGTVIQSYLYRSEQDVRELGKLGANLRIVKGAYKEPREVAYLEKRDVDANYLRLVKMHLLQGGYTAVATHDPQIIDWTKRLVREHHISNDQFEFQMLYGIAGTLQRDLVKEGYHVRVYTPYGKDWYPYFTRRIAERPANALFVLKGLLRR